MPTLKTLDEIFGVSKDTKYPDKSEEAYRLTLSRMSKFELQNECIKQKVNPRDTRDLMTKELISAFKRHSAGIAAAQAKPTVFTTNDAVKKIFRDH